MIPWAIGLVRHSGNGGLASVIRLRCSCCSALAACLSAVVGRQRNPQSIESSVHATTGTETSGLGVVSYGVLDYPQVQGPDQVVIQFEQHPTSPRWVYNHEYQFHFSTMLLEAMLSGRSMQEMDSYSARYMWQQTHCAPRVDVLSKKKQGNKL